MENLIIIKLGGSLIYQEAGQVLSRLGAVIQQISQRQPVAIVPGGGPFADTVRHYGQELNLAEATCHPMALLAMDQFGYLLRQFIPGSRLIEVSRPEDRHGIVPSQPAILLCSRCINLVPESQIPRCWDATSDTIAAYLAKLLNATLLIMIKSVDVAPEIKAPDVDTCFRQSLAPGLPVWFLNGRHPERLAELMTTGRTQGVLLNSHNSQQEKTRL
ncbi:hypothetical protein [Sporomusa sphaeroides]|uniref:amino acid kinase family protein n=1 Tax=Sporomusa sphaeroides TaxID=47679 RepID=UPI00202E22A8|nr:hypothetical protein [Sporomusa sphaeroides]MCM0759203.1 hypothetical protein [Sporomusa sphaeroides DSM 2875]HML35285.1 hypothetical protein [Sporomusa sphaeroides]